MFALFEINSTDLGSKGSDSLIKIDSKIQTLSWMSKNSAQSAVAGGSAENKKFDRNAYYQAYTIIIIILCCYSYLLNITILYFLKLSHNPGWLVSCGK
jgi:hypothetical protein